MQRLVLGLFDTRAAADAVVSELLGKGIPRASIHVTANHHADAPAAPSPGTEALQAGPNEPSDGGLIRRLLVRLGVIPTQAHHPEFLESEQRIFSESLRRGGVVVAVTVTNDRRLDQVEDAFERHGAVDIDERADEWRATGWNIQEDERTGEPVTPEVTQLAQNIGVIPDAPPRRRTLVFPRPEQPKQAEPTMSPEQQQQQADPAGQPHPEAPEPGGIDSDFRMHFGRIYGSSGHEYAYYLPAYRLGAELGRKHRSEWEQVREQARTQWEQLEPRRPWETVVDAVHYGFERTRTGSTTIHRPSEPPELPPRDESGAGEREPVIPPSPTTSERPM